jgi:hypothetical protein
MRALKEQELATSQQRAELEQTRHEQAVLRQELAMRMTSVAERVLPSRACGSMKPEVPHASEEEAPTFVRSEHASPGQAPEFVPSQPTAPTRRDEVRYINGLRQRLATLTQASEALHANLSNPPTRRGRPERHQPFQDPLLALFTQPEQYRLETPDDMPRFLVGAAALPTAGNMRFTSDGHMFITRVSKTGKPLQRILFDGKNPSIVSNDSVPLTP